jgi:hypothetical protein
MTGTVWIDAVLFVGVVAVLSVSFFRSDSTTSPSKPRQEKLPKRFCSVEAGGKMTFTDPDGRDPRRRPRKPARLLTSRSKPASRVARTGIVRDPNC